MIHNKRPSALQYAQRINDSKTHRENRNSYPLKRKSV